MPASIHARRKFVNVPLRTQDGRRVRFYDDLVRDQVEAAVDTAGGPATDADLADVEALEYTSRLPAVQAWPRLFLSAVVYRLAAELVDQ